MSNSVQAPNSPVTPRGINHLVLNVRDMEESHHFWSELLGFKLVGTWKRSEGGPDLNMRFYSGVVDDVNHHDLDISSGVFMIEI